MNNYQQDEGVSLHGHSQPEPIGLEYIAASLAQVGFLCNFRDSNELTVSTANDSMRLCLLSALSCELPQIIAAALRARTRGETTVLGGYHASGNHESLADMPFDYVVIGEGEFVSQAIAKAVLDKDNSDLDRYESNSVGLARVVRAPRIADLNSLPWPVRSESRMSQYQYNLHDLMWPTKSKQRNTALVLASRGCAHDCDFCASSTVWGTGLRLRTPENVVDELKSLKQNFGTNTIVFIDQSLGQSKRWSLDLCQQIQAANLGLNWYHQSNLNISRDVIKAMASAGCTKIGFGLEGISPRVRSLIKPRNPHELDSVNQLFDFCNSLGIFVKAYLMIGFPWETEEIVKEYFEWLPKIRANQIKISYFTPFPGTRDWTRFKSQLVTANWTDFNTVRMPVVYNPNISVDRYHEIRTALFISFYASPTYADLTAQMIGAYPHYIESYREFADFLHHFDMVSGDVPWLQWVRYGLGLKTSVAAGC